MQTGAPGLNFETLADVISGSVCDERNVGQSSGGFGTGEMEVGEGDTDFNIWNWIGAEPPEPVEDNRELR